MYVEKILERVEENTKWIDICCHDTPAAYVDEFIEVVFSYLKSIHWYEQKDIIHSLDMFAGDGRLGKSFSNKLFIEKKKCDTTFLEIDPQRSLNLGSGFNQKIIHTNAFNWYPEEKFDVVISNPPYRILNSNKCRELEIPWEQAKKYSRNLYALSIQKCLDVCEEGGLVAVIAPFSWLTGYNSSNFRNLLKQQCKDIIVIANPHRGLFDNVIQDIGIQLFFKSTSEINVLSPIKFYYQGNDKPSEITENNYSTDNRRSYDHIAKVGSIVWNRHKRSLTSNQNNSTLLIYGKNIKNGKLELNIPEYKDKQYIQKKSLVSSDLYKSPMILIRRVMRGGPGKWKIDSCIIYRPIECVIENHVIVIKLNIGMGLNEIKRIQKSLVKEILDYYYYSGSPSISSKIITSLLNRVI